MNISLRQQKAPCKGCTDRTVEPNCHTSCERYLTFKQRLERARGNKSVESEIRNQEYEAVRRSKKRSGS